MHDYCLDVIDGKLSLIIAHTRLKPLSIDFLAGKSQHRRRYGGGRGQLIAKAVGLKQLTQPTVLDVTAGLGQDAFVLACLGCQVTMVERSAVVAALLDDALKRLFASPQSHDLSLKLIHNDAQTYLKTLQEMPDVIYLDPMYPDTKNTALSKKEMRLLREIAGDDEDAADVLELALQKARHRVVVKRPRHGEKLGGREPDIVYNGRRSRFDVYITRD